MSSKIIIMIFNSYCLTKVWNLVESPEFEEERKDFIPRPDLRAMPKEGGEAVHFMR